MLKQNAWKDVDPTAYQEQDLFQDRDTDKPVESRPKGPFSFACGYIDRIPTVREFIENMVDETEQIMMNTVKQWELK